MNVTHRKNKSSITVMDNYESEKDYKELLKNYEKSIVIMTKNLEQKESLITKMTNEFEEYEIEYKEMCNQNSKLKKEIYELNNTINILENKIKELKEVNELLEESENYTQATIQPLKQKIYESEQNYNELQMQHSKLIIELANHNLNKYGRKNKNTFKVFNKKNTYNRRIKRKGKQIYRLIKTLKSFSNKSEDNKLEENLANIIDITVEDLNKQIKLLNEIIQERDIFIKDIQEKFDETLKIVDSQNAEMKRYQTQIETLQDLELSLYQLQQLIEGKINKELTKENTVNCNTYDDSKNTLLNEVRNNKIKTIKMLSDRTGRDMASILKQMDPDNLAVENTCNPYLSINEIFKDINTSVKKLNKNDVLVILIGDYNNDFNWDQYLFNVNKLCEFCSKKKITLFLSSVLYSNHSDKYMQKIYNINKGLYNILNGYNNTVFMDVNKIIFNNNKNLFFKHTYINKHDKISICKFIKECNMNQNMSNLNFIECTDLVNISTNSHIFLDKGTPCTKIQ